MEYIMVFLILIIVLLIFYLFLLGKELRRVSKVLKESKNKDSNVLIHQELSSRALQEIIYEMNGLLKENREDKINYERKNEAIRKMMMNISHDLRTPLTSALGYIDLVLHSNLSKEEKEHSLKIIEERLRRLEELIHSFFEFSCIVSSSKEIELEAVNLIGILEECIGHYYDDYVSSGRMIVFENEIKKYSFLSNSSMLLRVFDNLIGNAYKHSEGDLTIRVFEEVDGLVICFMNKLDYKELDTDHIFDEFYTVDISRTKGNTGLGLAIAKEFTENLGGAIVARKAKGNLEIVLSFNKNKK